MPRTCSICRHKQRTEIDQALLEGRPFRNVSLCFGTSTAALFRHRQTHIPVALAQAQQAEEVARGDDLLAHLTTLETDARRIQRQAEAGGDVRTALAAVKVQMDMLELRAKLKGELDERARIAVQVNVNGGRGLPSFEEEMRRVEEVTEGDAGRLPWRGGDDEGQPPSASGSLGGLPLAYPRKMRCAERDGMR